MDQTLPIDDVTPQVIDALRAQGRVVLQAPPGAGKTTRIPLAILNAQLTNGRILMLEPRRLAARAAAERMAQTLNEELGKTVGYRIRGEAKTSKETRIEVVTEGILTRMVQENPDLPGIGVVIFDEFHERSLNADLGLALCLEVAQALRDDLMLVAMSATLDADPIAEAMNAPIVTSEGRSFEVTPHWMDRPAPSSLRYEQIVANEVMHALKQANGSALVFLPGEGEIRRVQAILAGQLDASCAVEPLFGAMDFASQRRAISPAISGRKVVLATSIAETSLTIPDITIVVDGGRARRARFDASSGMSRLVTERVTRAEATQRAGRAGRARPGDCYKVWTKGENGALAAYPPAEIESGDLTAFALELAVWGAHPSELAFVTPPHEGRFAEAQNVLKMLEALDSSGKITPHGKELARFPLHPRLAHMLVRSGSQAADIAALLSERDILRGATVDLGQRVSALKDPARFGASLHRGALERVKTESKRLKRNTKNRPAKSIGVMTALAYPDRVGLRRAGDAPRFVLSGGKGAAIPMGDPMGQQRLIVATDLDGHPTDAKIRQAASISNQELRDVFADQITWQNLCIWSRRESRVLARKQERFGALILEDHAWTDAPQEDVARAMLEGVAQVGLRPSNKAKRLISRCLLMRTTDDSFPDFNAEYLMDTLEEWLLPHLNGVRSAGDWKGFELVPALKARLDWAQTNALDRSVPGQFTTPLGRNIPIDYSEAQPQISLRLQEVFGVTQHPVVGGTPLQVTLLSPAQRPIQVTTDLPGFWTGSYADVRKDMRAQYPKHPWPEDPTQADPTLRANRRKP